MIGIIYPGVARCILLSLDELISPHVKITYRIEHCTVYIIKIPYRRTLHLPSY